MFSLTLIKAKDAFTGLGQFTLNYIDVLASADLPDINFTLLTPHQFEFGDKTGFDIIEAGSADAIREAITQLVKNPKQNRDMAIAAQARIQREFNIEATVEQTLALYRKLVT